MVRLKNIKKNEDNHTIQADYIPEDSARKKMINNTADKLIKENLEAFTELAK